MKVNVTTVELSLAVVNKEIATFNINGAISGVVHLPSSGPVTVVLDGGYVLGEFHCAVCYREYKKSELHERKTDIYPFKRTIYLCEQCNEKRERRNALKNVKRVIRKPYR